MQMQMPTQMPMQMQMQMPIQMQIPIQGNQQMGKLQKIGETYSRPI